MLDVVISCAQLQPNGAHLSPRGRLFSMPVSARPPFKPPLCKSLCNFRQIYTEIYRTASFFSLSLSLSLPPSPPFLDKPELHHSLLPLCDLSPRTRLREPFPPPPPSGSCVYVGRNKLTHKKEKEKRERERHLTEITAALYWKAWFRCSPYRALKKARRPVSGDGWAKSFWIWKESRFMVYHSYGSAWNDVQPVAGAGNEERITAAADSVIFFCRRT